MADDDYEDFYDGDSAFGAFSDTTDTASMTSSIMKFREENGRTYHSYGGCDESGAEGFLTGARFDRALGPERRESTRPTRH